MKVKEILFILCVICVAGCVPSLHRLYTKETLIYDPFFVGLWQQDEGRWEFVGDPESKSYELTIVEKDGDKQSKLTAHLVQVGGQRFFDFYPSDDAELEGGEWLKFHVIAVHLFFKVEKTDKGFFVAAMNPDAIDNLLEQKPDRVKHERVEDKRVVLTDSPENLQKLLIKGLQIKDFFGDPVELERLPEPEPSAH